MIVTFRAEETEVIPPKAWRQLKTAFIAQAALYGVKLQVTEDPANVMDADLRYFQWVDKQYSEE